MNHPARPLAEQIDWIAENGFDFLDLTLEPPEAASWKVDAPGIREMLRERNLRVVGHTAPFLPIASPVEELRRASVVELRRCLDVFAAVGAEWMNVHPRTSPMHDRAFMVEQNLKTLSELAEYGKKVGVGVMVENLPGTFNDAEQLAELLEPLPELGLLLDIGHANLLTTANTTPEILAAHGSRLTHVHVSDNRGGTLDLHLPLGAGTLDIGAALRTLKSCGYDGTITLEVFSEDREHLARSREVLRRAWDAPPLQRAKEA